MDIAEKRREAKVKRERRRGGAMMAVGLLLILAALMLTGWNLQDERRAGEAADEALAALKAEMPALPVAADADGSELAWPVDESGAPMPWPVDDAGLPVDQVTDAAGQVFQWQGNSDVTDWIRNAEGALLPWLRDAAGRVLPWPVRVTGDTIGWDELLSRWNELIAQLLPYGQADETDYVKHPDMEMPTKRIGGQYYIGELEIPALGLELPVMDEWSYPRLRIAPCRYAGSVYSGDIVIAGHNYLRHFGRLKNLQTGDAVRFTDADGNVFSYAVSNVEILTPTDITGMCTGDWDMTLFTCTYGGAKRVTIRLKLVE